ncbi:CoB--CoM heterodisulfide reductase iron-sulfur subunit A family protein [candidate division WOR-3 bacterium]|nr:CoB--CoM heterodisulfide reductase iron-sulfur subunit A family protein [candidate division WOR-3 bacterium]
MSRIGVFICHCGLNIAKAVDMEKATQESRKIPGVIYATNYMYMCADPGQAMVEETIKKEHLDGIVIANCSPTLHEVTFRNVAERAGMNPYRCEIANIREQCSWPHEHEGKEYATEKAIKIIKMTVNKLVNDDSLLPALIPITKRALVIGGGIAGIQTALDIADGGFEVILVEKSPSIGGKMIQLSETFPTLDCPQCIETPKMVSCGQHSNIKIYAYSEVEEVNGYVGNFNVRIKQKASYIDREKCNGCGECMEKCLTYVDSEFDLGLIKRKAIYTPFPQAVPNLPVVDREHCGHFTTGLCRICQAICPKEAIDFNQEDTFVEEEVGAIIVATGFDLMPNEKIKEYVNDPDVVNGLEFERLLCPSGPTNGLPVRPSDWTIPKDVTFISCAGSRDPEHGVAYCSRLCCMYLIKQAMLYKHAVPDGQAYIFYIDIRSNGKGYEEFVQRAKEEDNVIYLRGKVSKIARENGKLKVWGVDTLTGEQVELMTDMVVLATAMIPSEGSDELARKLRLSTDQYGWFQEAHLKLRPLETLTSGIYIAGVSQFPKDITDAVSQASGAAAKVLALFSQDEIHGNPVIAHVDEEICAGCGTCEKICEYSAVEIDPIRNVAVVNEALCEGCGACAGACPSGAMQHKNFTTKQIFDMVGVATEKY